MTGKNIKSNLNSKKLNLTNENETKCNEKIYKNKKVIKLKKKQSNSDEKIIKNIIMVLTLNK